MLCLLCAQPEAADIHDDTSPAYRHDHARPRVTPDCTCVCHTSANVDHFMACCDRPPISQREGGEATPSVLLPESVNPTSGDSLEGAILSLLRERGPLLPTEIHAALGGSQETRVAVLRLLEQERAEWRADRKIEAKESLGAETFIASTEGKESFTFGDEMESPTGLVQNSESEIPCQDVCECHYACWKHPLPWCEAYRARS